LAQKYLKEAKKALGQKEQFYAHLEKALHNFLKAQLHINTTEMTRDNIRQKLNEKGISQITIDLLMDLLNRCNMARYAPATTTKMTQDLADAETLMNNFK
jgi:dTDP-4-amino-4,6-dideoxygalactose transaminase